MTEAAAVEKAADTTTTETTAETTTQSTAAATTEAAKSSEAGKTATTEKASDEAAKEFVADPAKSDEDNAKALAEWEKANPPDKGKEPSLPDNWRELAAGKDEDLLKLAKRYGSLGGILKALDETKKALRAGKQANPMPDPKDEKAMAEWRKAEGIPDDPTGYKLPDTIQKRLMDEDKPILSSFTEFAHAKGARPDVVEIASEWYLDMAEAAQAKQSEEDRKALEDAEDALRKDWSHGEYKANMTMAKRWIEGIPGIGADWAEARLPNGRLLGSDPAFISWASDQARQKFGDLAFSTSDSEQKHNLRRAEIEKIRDTDFDRYESEGLDKELRTLIEKDLARGKR